VQAGAGGARQRYLGQERRAWSLGPARYIYVCMYIYTYIYTYVYIHICMCLCVCLRKPKRWPEVQIRSAGRGGRAESALPRARDCCWVRSIYPPCVEFASWRKWDTMPRAREVLIDPKLGRVESRVSLSLSLALSPLSPATPATPWSP